MTDLLQAVAPLRCSNALLDDPAALRASFAADGYAYIRDLLPREPLLALRRRILELCAGAAWIESGSALETARPVRMPVNEGEPDYFDVYDALQRLEEFHALAHEPAVLRLMRALLGDTAFPHPLGIARLMFPDNSDWSTPPHQDYPNNQGTPDLYACWMPLGDCPMRQGGIAILENSHTRGVFPLEFALGAGGRRAALDEELCAHRWLSADFRTGDALVFHSHTVHRSLHNRTEGLRISCDFRYQRQGEALVERSLQPHFGRLSWDEIYGGWHGSTPRYYWRDLRYELVPWDPSWHELPESHLREAVRQQRAYDARRRPKD